MSTPNPARTTGPRARPAAGTLALLVALVVIALGVVAGQDALARWHVSGTGTSWLGSVLDGLDGLRAATWTAPVGVALVVAGLLVLVVTLKPRRRTHAQVDGEADVWVSPSALAALARDAAEGVPGVARVAVSSSRSAVRVRVASDAPDRLAGPVEEAVRDRLDGARVKVTVRTTRVREEGAVQ